MMAQRENRVKLLRQTNHALHEAYKSHKDKIQLSRALLVWYLHTKPIYKHIFPVQDRMAETNPANAALFNPANQNNNNNNQNVDPLPEEGIDHAPEGD